MPNNKNVESLVQLKEKLARAKSVVFADYKGVTANQSADLRKKLSDSNSEVEIAKNTLLKIALKESGNDLTEVDKTFEGSTALILGYEDPVSPIKTLFGFIKEFSMPKVKLGLLDGKFYSSQEMETLSKLPSKIELIAKVLGSLNAPISGFVNVLSGTKRNFVYALSEISKKKGV